MVADIGDQHEWKGEEIEVVNGRRENDKIGGR